MWALKAFVLGSLAFAVVGYAAAAALAVAAQAGGTTIDVGVGPAAPRLGHARGGEPG